MMFLPGGRKEHRYDSDTENWNLSQNNALDLMEKEDSPAPITIPTIAPTLNDDPPESLALELVLLGDVVVLVDVVLELELDDTADEDVVVVVVVVPLDADVVVDDDDVPVAVDVVVVCEEDDVEDLDVVEVVLAVVPEEFCRFLIGIDALEHHRILKKACHVPYEA